MAKIIPFPTRVTDDWAEFSGWIRDAFRDGAFSDEVLEIAIPRIKPHFENLSGPIQITLSETLDQKGRPTPQSMQNSRAISELVAKFDQERKYGLMTLIELEIRLALIESGLP